MNTCAFVCYIYRACTHPYVTLIPLKSFIQLFNMNTCAFVCYNLQSMYTSILHTYTIKIIHETVSREHVRICMLQLTEHVHIHMSQLIPLKSFMKLFHVNTCAFVCYKLQLTEHVHIRMSQLIPLKSFMKLFNMNTCAFVCCNLLSMYTSICHTYTIKIIHVTV